MSRFKLRPRLGAEERARAAADARARLLTPRLVVLFLAGCLLFGSPVLWPARPGVRVFGVPLLFVYLFVAWGAFIGALAWLLESATRETPPRREDDAP